MVPATIPNLPKSNKNVPTTIAFHQCVPLSTLDLIQPLLVYTIVYYYYYVLIWFFDIFLAKSQMQANFATPTTL